MHSVRVQDQRMHFSASHFLKSEDEVEKLHGHNYSLRIKLTGPLNDDGMVYDFREVKSKAIKICKTLDHQVLLPRDSETIKVSKSDEFIEVHVGEKRYVFPEEDCVIIPTKATTAELLAQHILKNLDFPKDFGVKVCVSESEGNTGCYKR
ncbi:MAG: 6-pyruvoyl tetrahydrobiopterin synthase [Candidatus Thorarchaeota archaeon]|nr:MAG: 6-pyruvoyl tetrahydrobiopterin synthase [Candidatus Thorarchaeota archaeon]